jgi:hypothetical protein
MLFHKKKILIILFLQNFSIVLIFLKKSLHGKSLAMQDLIAL